MDLRKGTLLAGYRFVLVKPINSMDRLRYIMETKKSIFMRHRMYPVAFIQNWQLRLIIRWLDNGWIWETNDLSNDEFEITE